MDLPSQPPFPYPVETLANPSQAQLKELALEHTPACTRTANGSINKVARNKARMAKYTYVIDHEGTPEAFSHNTIDPARAQELILAQGEYIRQSGKVIQIDGYVGTEARAVPVQWNYTVEGANIAGMQQMLSFPREEIESPEQLKKDFHPAFRLFYTPDFRPENMPGRQVILVDLKDYVTYIMGPDYFGESKKGALRMLAALHFRSGGLVLHAGAKSIHTDHGEHTMAILGLSGTGKTTTTFSKQGNATRPVQDDMITLWPSAEISVTENGCFAKTFGLSDETEPVLHQASSTADAWLENVYLDENAVPDFSKTNLSPQDVARCKDLLIQTGADPDRVERYISGAVQLDELLEDGQPKDGWDFIQWTENGRSIVPMSCIQDAADLHQIPKLGSLGILNRDEGLDAAMPGLVRFSSAEQAAGYLMLGETSKTSAAGKERGRTRSPFTQPFFPLRHKQQAERFSELAKTFSSDTKMWLMNTGYIGGDAQAVAEGNALKIKIRHSSAMLEAFVGGQIHWIKDPDFGYEVVDLEHPDNQELLKHVPAEILQPRRFFASQGRESEYSDWVQTLNQDRKAFFEKYEVEPAIIRAVVLD